MPPSLPVTETIVLHLKDGVDLEDVASSTDASDSPAVQAFVQLADTFKSQPGFIRQFWVIGHHSALMMRKLENSIGSSSRRSTHLCVVYR